MNSKKMISSETPDLAERIDALFQELQLAIKFDRPSILLAVYRSEFVREDVEAALTSRLLELNQQTERVYINEQNHDLPLYLRERADRAQTVFFVSGIRFGGGDDGQNAYRALNIRREYFVEYKLRLVLWLTEEEERLLPRYAPDFWAFRHLVVTFFDEPHPAQMSKHSHNLAWREFDTQWGGKTKEDTHAKIAYREKLLADLTNMPEAAANRLDLLYTLAPLYAAKGEWQKAVDTFQKVIALAPQAGSTPWYVSASFNGLGNVYSENGRYQDAIAAYHKAIELDPHYALPHNGLGIVYRDNGRYQDAITAFNKAIELNPNDVHSFNSLGSAYDSLEQYDEAISAYQEALKLNPDYPYAHNNLAIIYEQQRNWEKAIQHYQERVRLQPDTALSALVSLGKLARVEGDDKSNSYFEQALAVFDKAEQLRIQSVAGLLENKAFALLCLNQPEEAYHTMQEAIAKRIPDDNFDLDSLKLLATAPNPPEGLEAITELVRQAMVSRSSTFGKS